MRCKMANINLNLNNLYNQYNMQTGKTAGVNNDSESAANDGWAQTGVNDSNLPELTKTSEASSLELLANYNMGLVQNTNVNGNAGSVQQLDWNSFNIGSEAQFNPEFTANSQTQLERTIATDGDSHIYGNITESVPEPDFASAGQVILMNREGTEFFVNGYIISNSSDRELSENDNISLTKSKNGTVVAMHIKDGNIKGASFPNTSSANNVILLQDSTGYPIGKLTYDSQGNLKQIDNFAGQEITVFDNPIIGTPIVSEEVGTYTLPEGPDTNSSATMNGETQQGIVSPDGPATMETEYVTIDDEEKTINYTKETDLAGTGASTNSTSSIAAKKSNGTTKAASDLKAKINTAETAVKKANEAYDNANTKVKGLETNVKSTQNAIESLQKKLKKAKTTKEKQEIQKQINNKKNLLTTIKKELEKAKTARQKAQNNLKAKQKALQNIKKGN